MAHTYGAELPTSTGFLTEADEMSLAQSRARQSGASVPDTLEVRDDSLVVLQGQIEPWRRPAQMTLAAVAIGVILLIGGGLLTRRARVSVLA